MSVQWLSEHGRPDRQDRSGSDDRRNTAKENPHLLLLSVEQAARRLGISRAYAYELVLSGNLPSVKLGRLRKIRLSDLARFAESLPLDG